MKKKQLFLFSNIWIKIAPKKIFIPAPVSSEDCSCSNCPFMELNTMEKLRNCLTKLKPEITLSNEMLLTAKKPLIKMLQLS